jgi:5'(3')-deoxyribonucleotidase
LDQTVQLMQQFETDEDIARVAGGEPWNYSRKDIQGQYEISSAVDINNIDIERAAAKMDLIAKMLPFKQAGGVVFKAAANIVDPDLADSLEADEMGPVAQEREANDEYNSISQIMSGIEPRQNMMANPQFRLQIIQQIITDPGFMQKLQGDEVAQKRLQNRIKQYQDQIQQFQNNPAIGRQVATQTFKSQAPALQMTPAA